MRTCLDNASLSHHVSTPHSALPILIGCPSQSPLSLVASAWRSRAGAIFGRLGGGPFVW